VKVTADTITDEQIRELKVEATDHAVTVVCKQALRELPCNACSVRQRRGFDGQCPTCADERTRARARCAEIWNTRRGGAS
jgi:hypothetical protein